MWFILTALLWYLGERLAENDDAPRHYSVIALILMLAGVGALILGVNGLIKGV